MPLNDRQKEFLYVIRVTIILIICTFAIVLGTLLKFHSSEILLSWNTKSKIAYTITVAPGLVFFLYALYKNLRE